MSEHSRLDYDVPSFLRVVRNKTPAFIPPERVISMKVSDKKLILFTDDGEAFDTWFSMVKLLRAVPDMWVQTRHDYAVKRSEILHVVNEWVYLRNGDKAPVSRRHWYAFSAAQHRVLPDEENTLDITGTVRAAA